MAISTTTTGFFVPPAGGLTNKTIANLVEQVGTFKHLKDIVDVEVDSFMASATNTNYAEEIYSRTEAISNTLNAEMYALQRSFAAPEIPEDQKPLIKARLAIALFYNRLLAEHWQAYHKPSQSAAAEAREAQLKAYFEEAKYRNSLAHQTKVVEATVGSPHSDSVKARHVVLLSEQAARQEQKSRWATFTQWLDLERQNLIACFTSSSGLKSVVGLGNILRLQWLFDRLALSELIDVVIKLHRELELGKYFGNLRVHQSQLTCLNNITNFLSVAFFLVRTLINLGLVFKHTFFPMSAHVQKLGWWEWLRYQLDCLADTKIRQADGHCQRVAIRRRFNKELSLRFYDFENDIRWLFINAITNYYVYFGLTSWAALVITAGVLVGDVLNGLARIWTQYHQYRQGVAMIEAQQRQLLKVLIDCHLKRVGVDASDPLHSLKGTIGDDERYSEVDSNRLPAREVERQLQILLSDHLSKEVIQRFRQTAAHYQHLKLVCEQQWWQVDCMAPVLNFAAAMLLVAIFSWSLVLTPPLAILACYLVCAFCIALAGMSEKIAPYFQARLALKTYNKSTELSEELADNPVLAQLQREASQTGWALCWGVFQRALVVPVALIIFAFNPLLGGLFTGAYTTYWLGERYRAYASKPVTENLVLGSWLKSEGKGDEGASDNYDCMSWLRNCPSCW